MQTTYNQRPDEAVAGLPVGHCDFDSRYNAEASAGMPFGCVVRQGTLDDAALILTTSGQVLTAGVGVVVRDSFDPDTQLDASGYLKPTQRFRVVRRGRIWMPAEKAIAITASVFVRTDGMAGSELAGDVRDDADTNGADDCSHFMRFVSSVGAAGLVLVEVDFTNRAA